MIKKWSIRARFYLLDVINPNFYFHVTTAYAILRHHGVELGKRLHWPVNDKGLP